MHVSNWICETAGHLALSPKRVASKLQLPKQSCLQTTDACKIIYPGKNHSAWWDLNQLHDQMVDAADFFEYLHLEKVGIWIFDCSSAHEGLAADVLNVNNMNVNPRGKQKLLHTTIMIHSHTCQWYRNHLLIFSKLINIREGYHLQKH